MLNAVPVCEALAVRNPDLRQAIEEARPYAPAHLLVRGVDKRIADLNMENRS